MPSVSKSSLLFYTLGIIYIVKKKYTLSDHIFCQVSCFHEYGSATVIIYLRVQMNFGPSFPYCVTESDVNMYSGSLSLLKGVHEILSVFSVFFI
jgi:hypothetical protein